MSHGRQIWPRKTIAGQQHVANERLDWRFTHKSNEKQLLNHLKWPKTKAKKKQSSFQWIAFKMDTVIVGEAGKFVPLAKMGSTIYAITSSRVQFFSKIHFDLEVDVFDLIAIMKITKLTCDETVRSDGSRSKSFPNRVG